ncbi:MAG: hypothetical protein F2840_18445 [Actinobacteria bacterium]|uniref:Unannotated protein n=1 Tax=freshwater metagenome TaxID=449393 RepID=A0A6J7M966_9ZZZZ|nr:hypothetical protein [Actinomycetota bacterium]
MAEDDIERLLREVAESTGSGSSTGPSSGSKDVARQAETSSTASALRLARSPVGFAVVAGAVIGFAGWVVGLVLPFLGAGSMGTGAAFGAFITVLVTGAPRWISR